MFGTEMEQVTFVILVFQVLVLSAQSVIYFSRPDDKSRLRFSVLIIAYVLYNIGSGLFPDPDMEIPMIVQFLIEYCSAIYMAIYFICYIYDEYQIQPVQPFTIKSLTVTLVGSFILLFIIPYLRYGDLALSRELFLPVPALVAIVYFYKISRQLYRIYRKDATIEKPYKLRLISSNLGLLSLTSLPVIAIIGNYQVLQHIVVNFGFILMMITYMKDFIVQAQNEAILLTQLPKKEDTVEIQIADTILDELLQYLRNFEDQKAYLRPGITMSGLAKKFNTNNRYLSYVVNKYKGQTFKRYINDLRIDYLIKRLDEDEQFRNQYTVKAMADEIGFTNSDALGRAFVKSKKVRFSKYLKKVRAS